MTPNLATVSDDLINDLAVKAITDALSDMGEDGFDGEVLQESALCRYEELTKPLVVGREQFFADTVQEALIYVAAREIETEGAEPFSIGMVVDVAMAKLERGFGKPQNPAQASEAIREYVDEAHSLK